MRVPAAGEDRKTAVFGAVEYGSGRVVWRRSPRKDSETFLGFLEQVSEAFPEGPVVVVLDNVGYHKSRACRTWWARHAERVRPCWLPAYTPHLNLMERVWRYLKSKLACHRWWADLPALEAAADEVLAHLHVRFGQDDGPTFTLAQNFGGTA